MCGQQYIVSLNPSTHLPNRNSVVPKDDEDSESKEVNKYIYPVIDNFVKSRELISFVSRT